jgi:hypothetical protein
MSVQQLVLPMTRRGRSASATRARLTGAALSVLWHLGLLAALIVLVAKPLSPRIEPAVEVFLVPPFTIPRLALPRPLAPPRGGSNPALSSGLPRTVRLPTANSRVALPLAAGPVDPAPAADGTAASDAAGDPEVRNKVQAMLRATLGCVHPRFVRLSDIEQEHCRNRALALGRDAPDMPLANIDPVKVAYFDAVAAAYKAAGHEPRMLCRFGANAKASARGLQMGPLACQIIPPQGILTEETGLSPP